MAILQQSVGKLFWEEGEYVKGDRDVQVKTFGVKLLRDGTKIT